MALIKPWQKRIIRWVTSLAMVLALLVLMAFSPFYARAVLWALNKIPVTVNQIAAASQKNNESILTLEDQPETGSPEWLAQQQKAQEQAQQQAKLLSMTPEYSQAGAQNTVDTPTLIEAVTQAKLKNDEKVALDAKKRKARADKINQNAAHVIIVLGGGLGRDVATKKIIVNQYTRLRLEQAVLQQKQSPLPILLSGVEAPYMQKWLATHHVDAQLLEGRSMNTCENTRFSALLLQKKGGAPRVELITDAYHMPRARRLFAINGIDTIPVVAQLPNRLTPWQPSSSNLMHSRRATYEAIATVRDLWVGETNCREVP
jgi:uncharacterized SAM-binding protein YcdF (DUF218 family)